MSNVGEQKYPLVPSTIDLTGDGHGHHVPGTPYVYKHGWKLRSSHTHTKSVPGGGTKVTQHTVSLVDKKGRIKGDPATLRHYRHVTRQERMTLYDEAGLKLNEKFSQFDEETLIEKWHSPTTQDNEREDILNEVQARMKRLSTVASALDQSVIDAKREDARDWWRTWDKHLRRVPGGKHVIDLREKLLSDKVLDKSEPVRAWFKEHGKEYAKHAATGLAIAMLLHPLGLAAGGVFAHEAGREAVAHLLEHAWVEWGLAVGLSGPVTKALHPFFKHFEREAKIERAKKVLRKRKHGYHVNARFVPKAGS